MQIQFVFNSQNHRLDAYYNLSFLFYLLLELIYNIQLSVFLGIQIASNICLEQFIYSSICA